MHNIYLEFSLLQFCDPAISHKEDASFADFWGKKIVNLADLLIIMYLFD